jgi:hypothetical protein
MTYSLDVVADLLCDQLGDVLDEGVLDADFVAVWRGDGVSRAFSRSKEVSIFVNGGHTVGRNDSEPCTMQSN